LKSKEHSKNLSPGSSRSKLVGDSSTGPSSEQIDQEYFLPDIKDYHRIVERGLERLCLGGAPVTLSLSVKSYEHWCSLVKLCFPDPTADSTVMVSSLELMRLHPVFNRLSSNSVKDFLSSCKLIKLRENQLLYRQDDPSDSVYIILFGKLILHNRSLGAIGVVGLGQTLGEEALTNGSTGIVASPNP
jgi:hypothetical protein